MILGALLAAAWAQAPSLWIEPGVGAWRSVSCACVDNMLGELGAGLSLPLSERVALELHPRWQAAGYPLGAGLHMWTFSAGVQLRAAEPSPSPVLGFGLSRSHLNTPYDDSLHRGVWLRAGLSFEPRGWLVEPGLELAATSGDLSRTTLSLTLRLGRRLAPAPPPR